MYSFRLRCPTACVVLVLGLFFLPACADEPVEERAPDVRAERLSPHPTYIVVLRPNAHAPSVARVHGLQPTHVYAHALNGFAAQIPPQALRGLSRNPHVRYIEPDRVFQVNEQTVPTGVTRIDAHLNGTARINGIDGEDHTPERVDADVAVIDTGVLRTHEDLNVYRWTNCARGGPFGGNCRDNDGTDGYGHGTHVAGTIGALDNGKGVVGVAPGVRIWSAKALNDQGSGYTSWIVGAIDWVTENSGEIEVANLSLGGSGTNTTCTVDPQNGCDCGSDSMHEAICNGTQAGVVFVVAAGNADQDAATYTPARLR